jgi:RNA polymerase sigma-70 factor (ECF subfamily)
VHLLFTTGHTAPSGADLIRRDLTERAIDLARMLHTLLPENPDVTGLLALLLLTDARRAARTAADGSMLRLSDQDRTRWDRAQIAEGIALVRAALNRTPGRYALQAAIAAVHAEAAGYADTDWAEIAGLYDVLIQVWPSPVVALNRAVAVGMAHGPAAGLDALDELSAEPQLAGYGYLPAARAHFLAGLDRMSEARLAYGEALLLTENAAERAFLADRAAELDN